MSVAQASRPVENSFKDFIIKAPWWRSLVLAVLLAVSLAMSALLIQVSPHIATAVDADAKAQTAAILKVYLPSFLPYLVACLLVLLTRPASGRWRWVEVGMILSGALLLRVVLLPLPPNLSRDSWRYVWDARVFLHGYSPYVYAPGDKLLIPLRNFLLDYSRYRNVPSIYPPGAQYIYALSYLLAPDSLYFLKGIFVLFEMVSCVVLTVLLMRKGLDPARVIIYAWCPLPIVEFALQGHMDVLAITFTLLAMLTSSDQSRRGRVLTGFLVGLGALAKIYPIVMLVPLVRLRAWRRDFWLVLTCLLTIIIGYIPFYIQGNGQIFGFFAIYANEQGQNAGVIQQVVSWLGRQQHVSLATLITQEHLVAVLVMVGAALTVFLLRQRERISSEAGTLVLLGLVLAVSSHVFPWYTATLLSWVVLLLPARGQGRFSLRTVARTLAVASIWFLTCICVSGNVESWPVYYLTVYDPLVVGLVLAGLIYLYTCVPAFKQKGILRGKRSANSHT